MIVSLRISVLASLAYSAVAANSILFKDAAAVISFNNKTDGVEVLYNASVLVTGDKVTSIFSESQSIDSPSNTTMIPSQGKIISPGFIDTHRHLWQTAYKTLESNTSLAEYFLRYGEYESGRLNYYTPEDVYLGQLTGIYESLNAGVTSILDHSHHTWSPETTRAGLQATVDSGARVWWPFTFHTLNNGTSLSSYTRDAQVQDFLQLSENGPWRNSSTVSFGVAYDEWTVQNASMVKQIIDLANSQNISSFTTHYLGGPWGYSNSPVLLDSLDFLNTSFPIVFSHASYMSVQDAQLLRDTNQYISITPESERHYGHGDPSSPYVMDQASLGIYTHFTFSADIIGQASNNPMSAEQAFLLATRAGAKALRRNDIGVLVEGAKADLVVFDGTSPNMLGWADPVAAVMLHSNPGNIEHVLVDGQFRKRYFQLVLPEKKSYSDLQSEFLKSARRIQANMQNTPLPKLTGTFLKEHGANYAEAITVDVMKGPENGYGNVVSWYRG